MSYLNEASTSSRPQAHTLPCTHGDASLDAGIMVLQRYLHYGERWPGYAARHVATTIVPGRAHAGGKEDHHSGTPYRWGRSDRPRARFERWSDRMDEPRGRARACMGEGQAAAARTPFKQKRICVVVQM